MFDRLVHTLEQGCGQPLGETRLAELEDVLMGATRFLHALGLTGDVLSTEALAVVCASLGYVKGQAAMPHPETPPGPPLADTVSSTTDKPAAGSSSKKTKAQ